MRPAWTGSPGVPSPQIACHGRFGPRILLHPPACPVCALACRSPRPAGPFAAAATASSSRRRHPRRAGCTSTAHSPQSSVAPSAHALLRESLCRLQRALLSAAPTAPTAPGADRRLQSRRRSACNARIACVTAKPAGPSATQSSLHTRSPSPSSSHSHLQPFPFLPPHFFRRHGPAVDCLL